MPWYFVIPIAVIGILIILFIVFFIVNGVIFTHLSFRRRKGDKDFAKNEDERAKKAPDRLWFFSNKIEEVNLVSHDKLNLKSYLLSNNSNNLAILIHGYHGRYYSVVSQARIFFELGYDVLCINNRCHDTSEGKYFTMGKLESSDTLNWIDLMLKRNPNYEIVLYGISMGGHIALQTAALTNLYPEVKCVISDCAYCSLKEQLIQATAQSPAIYPKMVVELAEAYSKMFYRFDYSCSLDKTLKNVKIPVCLIHGTEDNYVYTKNIDLIYDSIPENIHKEKHYFEGSGHTRSVVDDPKKYRRIVKEFTEKFIK